MSIIYNKPQKPTENRCCNTDGVPLPLAAAPEIGSSCLAPVVITEHTDRAPYTCTFCHKRIADGNACTVTVDGVPVDGEFCCERCAENEVRSTVFVDACLGDEKHPGRALLEANINRGFFVPDGLRIGKAVGL